MATTTASRKQKGRKLQQYVRDKLKTKYTPLCAHCLSGTCTIDDGHPLINSPLKEGDIESRMMSGSGTDIVLSPLAKTIIPYDIECKNTETASVWQWIQQAETNTEKGRIPLIVFKRNHSKVYCIISFDDFLEVAK
jgi:hypothetical protein